MEKAWEEEVRDEMLEEVWHEIRWARFAGRVLIYLG
jgi:hypothetical protein